MIAAAVFAASLLTTLALWRGFVISVLWQWCVVPTFGGPQVGVAAGIGIALLVGVLVPQGSNNDDGKGFDADAIERTITGAFMKGVAALAVGYILHTFLGATP